jgi:flavin-binding protein dodecin
MEIEKHIQVTGKSNVSWKDAIVSTVSEVARTINYLTSVKILDQRAKITVDKMTEYYVDLDITFMVEQPR